MKQIKWEWQQEKSLTNRLLDEMQYDDAEQCFVCGDGSTIKRAFTSSSGYCNDDDDSEAVIITVWQDGPLTEADKQAIIEQLDPELLEDDDDNDEEELPDPAQIIGTSEEEAKIPEWVHGIEAVLGHPLPEQVDCGCLEVTFLTPYEVTDENNN